MSYNNNHLFKPPRRESSYKGFIKCLKMSCENYYVYEYVD